MIIDIIFVILNNIGSYQGYQPWIDSWSFFTDLQLLLDWLQLLNYQQLLQNIWDKAVKVSDKWLPVISFAIVFIVVVLMYGWGKS